MQEYTPAALAAYLRRSPTQAMREAIEEYEAGHITIGELESKLIFLVERERDLSATRERQPEAGGAVMSEHCERCGRWYNDEYQWTICPHNPLEAGPRPEDYCRRHDFFGPCPICKGEPDGKQLPNPIHAG